MKLITLILCLVFVQAATHTALAQEKNPLINSGDLIGKGSDLYDSGEYKRSLDLYKKVDRNDTNYVRALYETALTYYADSQFNESIHYCKKAFAAEVRGDTKYDPQIYDEYGNAVDAAGDPQRALQIFDSAIQKYPAYALLYMNKGTVLIKLDRDKEAEQVFQQALLIDPYSYTSHFKLAVVALRQGKLIPAMLSLIGYLLMNPEGRYHTSCINLLGSISRNEDEIRKYVNGRKETPPENYQLLEQIIQSKIALDRNYKPIIHLDDAVSRQIQVLFEKMQYEEGSKDFYMQYYVPYFRSVFSGNQFELFINHLFSGVELPAIQSYIKKNKKEIAKFTGEAGNYFNTIRSTRELVLSKRDMNKAAWYYANSKPIGNGRAADNGSKLIGPWEFCYEYGNMKAKGLYSESGEKEGPWVYYYFDGQLKGKELYHNGKQEGEETYYFESGLPSSHSSYKNNLLEGESTTYFMTGVKHYTDHYIAGKEDGEKSIFYSTGGLSILEHYKAGLMEGTARSFNQDGSLDYVADNKNGKLEGSYKKYFDNGQLSSEGMYSQDQQTGLWKYYFENGKLKKEQSFVAGKPDGVFKQYYENGQLDYTYTSKKGKADGEEQFYDEDGKLYGVFVLDNGRLMGTRYMDKTGKVISESGGKQKLATATTYDGAGIKKTEGTYNERGNNDGKKTYFYPSGAVSQTEYYKDGDLDGPTISYFADGSKKEESVFKAGEKEGYTKSRYLHGQIKAEGWYVKNQAQGYWLYYNELGDLTDSIYYLNDEMNGVRGQFTPGRKKEYETEYKSGWLVGCTQYDSTGKEIKHIDLPSGTGRYTLIYANGNTYLDVNYTHGNLDGTRKTFYFDGKPRTEEYFKNGLQDSVEKNYTHSGKLTMENWYHLGAKVGTWKYYDAGKLIHTEEYKNGVLNGKRIYYFTNGNKEEETMLKDDELDGTLKKYDPSGALLYQLTYKGGNLISYTYQDKNGQLLKEIPIPRETAKFKTYFSDGTVSAELEFKDGYLDGAFNLYYTNGKIRNTSVNHYNMTEGPLKTYYANGQLKHDYVYLHDNLNGHYKEYNEKGILTEEGTYYNGSPHGIIKYFDDNGAPAETAFYYYGKLLSVKK